MQTKINLELCLELMGLETLVETEEKTRKLESGLCTFEEVESKTTYDEKSSYKFSFRRKESGRETNYQLTAEIEKKKIIAHYVCIEEESHSLSDSNDDFQEY